MSAFFGFKKKFYVFSAAAGFLFGSFGGLCAAGTEQSRSDVPSVYSNQAVSEAFFTDISADSWYYPYVSYLAERGVVKGMTETEFVPTGTFTVAESAAIITRYLGLETEAADRGFALTVLSVTGHEKWYAGYIQLMHEAGIIDVTKYGCSLAGRHISIDTPSLLEAPVKRSEFAAFITRSFDLSGTPFAENAAHDFIYGGSYDQSALDGYIPLIHDYDAIPADERDAVLKAYYNGIFNGDDNGNFNPHGNLTRAEMAKVTAVILDSSLRTRLEPSTDVPVFAPQTPLLDAESYLIRHGVRYLKPAVSDAILERECAGVSIAYRDNAPYVTYTPQGAVPNGYRLVLYHYQKNTAGYDVCLAEHDARQSYEHLFSAGDRLILVLTDTSNGEAVDAFAYTLSGVGVLTGDACRYAP